LKQQQEGISIYLVIYNCLKGIYGQAFIFLLNVIC